MADLSSMDPVSIAAGLLGGGGLTGFVTALINRRKVKAEAAISYAQAEKIRSEIGHQVDPDAATNKLLLETLQAMQGQLRTQIEVSEQRETALLARVAQMDSRIQQLQHENAGYITQLAEATGRISQLEAILERLEKRLVDPFEKMKHVDLSKVGDHKE